MLQQLLLKAKVTNVGRSALGKALGLSSRSAPQLLMLGGDSNWTGAQNTWINSALVPCPCASTSCF